MIRPEIVLSFSCPSAQLALSIRRLAGWGFLAGSKVKYRDSQHQRLVPDGASTRCRDRQAGSHFKDGPGRRETRGTFQPTEAAMIALRHQTGPVNPTK